MARQELASEIESKDEKNEDELDPDTAKDNLKLSILNVKNIYPSVYFLSINLGMVYFLEYLCTTSFADLAN